MAAAVAAGVGLRADDIGAGLEAVVVERLGHAVAVGIEHAADMGERVPLRRILQRQDHAIVARHVHEQRVDRVGEEVEPPAVLVAGRRQHRRQAARVQHVAARQVERQAEAEGKAFLHFGDAFQHLLGRDEVQPAELIVIAPIAPGRAFRAMLPALHLTLPVAGRAIAYDHNSVIPTGAEPPRLRSGQAPRGEVEGPVQLPRRHEEVPRRRRPLGGFARDDGKIVTCESPAVAGGETTLCTAVASSRTHGS